MAHKSKLAWIAAGGAIALLVGAVTQATAADITKKFAEYSQGSDATVDHSAWDDLLKKYIVAGPDGLNRVRYQAFKENDHSRLKGYVKMLEAVRPAGLARPEQFAYWANLYNAKTIDVVLDAYPVKSIREISIKGGLLGFLKKSVGKGGPWKAEIMTVEGERLSLDNIEHDILRPVFKDPRVHYAVNCASIGCPNLQTEAFTGAKLDGMLNAGARAYINSPRGFAVDDGGVTASSIYEWFVSDFGGNAGGVLRHAAQFAEPELKQKLTAAREIARYRYNWDLNDAQ